MIEKLKRLPFVSRLRGSLQYEVDQSLKPLRKAASTVGINTGAG